MNDSKDLQVWQDNAQLAEVKKIYGGKLTEGEFVTFVQIGKALNLNPFLKEIWAVKYGNSAANIFVGRDGYRKNAQENPDYDYHSVDAVYSKDEFSVENGDVKHKYNFGTDRGTIVGAYCIVKRKGSSKPIFTFVEHAEYNTKKSVWLAKPATMIKKVAEAQGLRMAFQKLFSGTYDESEDWRKEAQAEVNVVAKVDIEGWGKKMNECKTDAALTEVLDSIRLLSLTPEESKALAQVAVAKKALFKKPVIKATSNAKEHCEKVKKQLEALPKKPVTKPIEGEVIEPKK